MGDTNYILAAGGQPFQDWDAANLKRRTVARELDDEAFQVVRHPHGGFAIARDEAGSDEERDNDRVDAAEAVEFASVYEVPEAPGDVLTREFAPDDDLEEDNRPPPEIGGVMPPFCADDRRSHANVETPPPTAAPPPAGTDKPSHSAIVTIKNYSNGFPEKFGLNVAPRAFIHLHLFTSIGLVLMLFPHLLLAPLGGFVGFENAKLGASVLGIIRMGAMLFAICALSQFLYTYLLYRYVVTNDFVEANFGFIARDAPKVFFAHIRTTNVVQSWWQRLLVVGDVKLGTGATDQHEVVLRHISDPKLVEKELERRYLPYIRSARRPLD